MRLNIPGVRDALQNISADCAVRALITSAFHIPHHFLQTPTYFYFTSCVSVLSFFLQLPAIHNQTSKSFGALEDSLLHLPGLPTIRASLLPEPLLDRNASTYHHFLDSARSLPKFQGLIVNTFNLLEPDAIKAIADGVCVPDGTTPPLYCIGPLIADEKDRTIGSVASPDVSTVPVNEYLCWLDLQPSRSVVFLCFGSRGAFDSAQVKEIALGLERSEQRFLWVVRNPPPSIAIEPDLDHLMPQGFLERTQNKGLVIKSWAPQAAILKHESVGGFVTHCGWNSVLEAVSFGVPMVAWPLYAEQRMNSVVLVEKMKLAVPISDSIWSYEKGKEGEFMVSAEEVQKRVRQLIMEVNMRERSAETKERGIAAWTEGGSSFLALSQMVGSWKQG